MVLHGLSIAKPWNPYRPSDGFCGMWKCNVSNLSTFSMVPPQKVYVSQSTNFSVSHVQVAVGICPTCVKMIL